MFTPIKIKNRLKSGDGRFEYVFEPKFRNMLRNAFATITILDLWGFVIYYPITENFASNIYPEFNIICKKMETMSYFEVHNYDSYNIIMQNMQYMAINGEEKWKFEYENNPIPNIYFHHK